MRNRVIILILVLFSANIFSQDTNRVCNEYYYRVKVGYTKPSFFPEYSKKISNDSIIEIELAVIGTINNLSDTNKYGGKYAVNDLRNEVSVYQNNEKIDIDKRGNKYFCKLLRENTFRVKYGFPGDIIDNMLYIDKDDYGCIYQLKKIIFEEGKGSILQIPIIKSKRPLSQKEITEIIDYIREDYPNQRKEPRVFKNKTATLTFEY